MRRWAFGLSGEWCGAKGYFGRFRVGLWHDRGCGYVYPGRPPIPGISTGPGPNERGDAMDDDSESNWVVLGRHLRVVGLAILGVVLVVAGFGALA